MFSDFDNIIKEKLQGYKADYNSADWDQMEALLPEKPRRPYALVALLLLFIGVAGLWIGSIDSQNRNATLTGSVAETTTVLNETEGDALVKNNGAAETPEREHAVTIGTGSKNYFSEKLANEKQQQIIFSGNDAPEIAAHEEIPEKRDLVVRTFSEGGIEVAAGNGKVSAAQNNRLNEVSATGLTAPAIVAASSDHEASVVRTTGEYGDSGTSQESAILSNAFIESLEEIEKTALTQEAISLISLNLIEAGLIPVDNRIITTSTDAKVEPRKMKKPVVVFAMGAGAGISFSFTNAGQWTKPGYSAGITEELMFINRIGLVFTQAYSARKYDGGQYPCPEGVADCPFSYSSTVRSVDLAIGARVNLIHKTRWSWYIKAGVTNVVKFYEQFSYYYPEIDTVSPPPQLPPTTNFNGTTNEFMFEIESFGLSADPIHAPDLTISGTKRYHIAFNAGTGFEVALTPRIRMQIEAGHTFTRPIVGDADNRLQSFGVNGNLLYRFSK